MFDRLRRIVAPSTEDHAREFWTWFAANAEVVGAIAQMPPEEREHTARVLHRHLRRADERLSCLVGRPADDATTELIISADGRRDAFGAADALVAAAPRLEGWRVIALKPPMRDIGIGAGEGVVVHARDLRFARQRSPAGQLGITVVYPRAWPGEARDYQLPVTLLLEQYLGERAFAGGLDALLVAPDDGSVPAGALRPLAALPELIAGAKAAAR